ncbi:MAG: biotin transporter BioY [Spirochaetaceae bacterium]|nr:biotin transporter BioY [Spirochaetaceae bacterium]
MEQSITTRRKMTIRLSLVALFAALTAAGTFIAIPLPVSPVPIVLQNLFAVLSGLLLGPALGSGAVGLFLIAGTIGLPIFSGASGGIAHFLKPSGGYLPGYLLAALCAGLIVGTPRSGQKTPLWRIIVATISGFLIIYLPGVPWLKVVLDTSWAKAVAVGFVPYIIGDFIKAVVAVLITSRLRKVVGDNLG